MTKTGPLYVYGVMAAADRRSLPRRGVGGAAVSTVEHGGVMALTSQIRSDTLKAAAAVRAHWRVLQEVSEVATVLPVRFGTLVENESVLRERLLEPNAARLAALLEQLAGCVQLTVKGQYDEDKLLREVVRESRAVASLRERVNRLPPEAGYYERIRLGELVAEEVARRREADTQLALDIVGENALDVRVEQESTPSPRFSVSFLVRRETEPDFGRRVDRLAASVADRLEIRCVGPLPPYSFAEADLETEATAWA